MGTERKQDSDTWQMESACSVAQNLISYLLGTQQAHLLATPTSASLWEHPGWRAGPTTGSVEAGGTEKPGQVVGVGKVQGWLGGVRHRKPEMGDMCQYGPN